MQEFFTISVGTILFTLINTLILFLAFKFLLWNRVDAILQKRAEEVDEVYATADQSLAEAKRNEEHYSALIAQAREESADIVARAEKRAIAEGEEILEEARAEARAERDKASRAIDRERVQARAELQGEISDIAMQLAEKIMAKEISKDDHVRLIDEFLDEMGDQS